MERVVGVDVTRGLAVLGMFAAHVGSAGPDLWSGTGLLGLADGRSAATFALLAGLSAALLSGGHRPVQGDALRRARVRILTRAVLLVPLGAALVLLRTPVAVILPGYAVMFALVTVALRWRVPVLLGAAAVVVLVGPPVVQAARSGLDVGGTPVPWRPLGLLVGEYYPAAVWIAYLLVGLAVGRTDLLARRTAVRLTAVGAACAVVGYLPATLLLAAGVPDPRAAALLSVEPHADTAPEVVGNVGVSLLVLGLACLAARRLPRTLYPLAATGALALTVYCAQLVVIAGLGPVVVRDARNEVLLGFVVVTLLLTTVWRLTLGRGPLERLLHGASSAAADAVVPRERSGASQDLAVQHGEPAVGGGAPGGPRVGDGLQGDVVGEAVVDRLPREVRRGDPLGPEP